MTMLEPDELRQLLADAAAGPTTGDFDQIFRQARRHDERRRLTAMGAVMVLVAIAIVVPTVLLRGSSDDHLSGPAENIVPVFLHGNPRALIGSWSVTAPGEKPNTPVRIDAELTITRACGDIQGFWKADPRGLFSGFVDGGSQACLHSPEGFHAAWVTDAVTYRQSGKQMLLLGSNLRTLATLTPQPPTPGDAPDAQLLRSLRTPAPLPAGVEPATMLDLQGRWKAIDEPKESPAAYAEFRPTTWFATDGCNGEVGQYVVGPGGDILTTAGGTTTVLCGVGYESTWIYQARRVGIQDGHLELFAVNGKRLGALAQQQTGTVTGVFQRVGGPAPGAAAPLKGTISVQLPGRMFPQVVRVDVHHGRFRTTVPIGRYRVIGFTPSIRINGHATNCRAAHLVTVFANETSQVTVTCQIR
jgi:hypothetical protein